MHLRILGRVGRGVRGAASSPWRAAHQLGSSRHRQGPLPPWAGPSAVRSQLELGFRASGGVDRALQGRGGFSAPTHP